MLALLPPILITVLLAILGAIVGPFINWAIYSWAMFGRRPISPWMKLDDEETELFGTAENVRRIPVLGWWTARKINFGAEVEGKFWVRPLLIELAWIIGLPLVFFWYSGGGLLGAKPMIMGAIAAGAGWSGFAETWFWSHSILLALLFIATFIDFDEKMIPDQITVPGVLIGLTIAAAFPWSRLPELGATAAGPVVSPITFASPHAIAGDHWCYGVWGLAAVIAIFVIWVLALLPRISPFNLGLGAGIKYTIGSIVRPKRKSDCAIRIEQRGPFGVTKVLAAIFVIGIPLLIAGWALLPGANWTSLFGAMVGLAVSGGLIWAIRIVGGLMMGQQAMGFGDVTLMAMVGTFIGWQASLAAFFYGIMIAMLAVIVMVIFIRNSHIAFGPYLSMGTVAAVYNWSGVWSGARMSVFFFGPYLLLVLLASLIGMVILLPIVRWLKGLLLVTP
jgi:prepilin signal peptidase PulO-like enzyme (type II secretory pathway)